MSQSGVLASVLLPVGGGDYSNGGVSGRSSQVVVVLPGGGPIPANGTIPAVEIVKKRSVGGEQLHVAVPVDGPDDERKSIGPMMGGAYIASSDSRFRELVPFYGAVPLHDRWETPEQYEALSI